MTLRRITTACLLIAVLAVVCMPSQTQAADGTAVATIFSGAVLDMVADALGLMNSILVWAIGLLAGWLQGALELDPSGGGAIIYTAWRTLRDLCNMAFIIALILMAFGTIFDSLDISFLKPYSISGNGRSAIAGFLMAAIFLNFSLAIGQTVMAASNRVSDIVLTLLPKNLGPQIAQRVGFAQVANGIQPQTPLVLGIPPELLAPDQYAALQTWNPERLRLLNSCLAGEFAGGAPAGQLKPGVRLDTPAGCFEAVQGGGPGAYESGVLPGGVRSPGLDALVTNEALLNAVIPGAGTALKWYNKYENLSTQDLTGKQSRITGYIFSIIMLGSLLLSFISMLAFAVVRIPMLWILLALSPIAWTSLAFPGATFYKDWWKQFWAWNLFSPLYLFVIYLGMLLLQNTNVAIASLGAQGSPFLASAGVAFQYLIAAMVFTGGAGLVLKASFLSGTIAGTWVSRITGFTGIGGPGGAFGPVGRFLGYTTGATAAYKGVVGGITSKYEDLTTKPGARRQEEVEARFKRLGGFGDRSAAEKLQQTRLKEQLEKNKERGVPIADLRKDLGAGEEALKANKAPDTKYFAAAKTLLDDGELKPEEVKRYMDAAGGATSTYGRAFAQSVREAGLKKLKERAKDKKYKSDAKGVGEVLDLMGSMSDDERKTFLGELERNQPLLRAKLAGDQKIGAMTDKETGKVLTTTEILERSASKLSDAELVELYKERKGGTMTLGPQATYILNDKLGSKEAKKLLRTADPVTREELRKDVREQQKKTLREQAEEKGKLEDLKEEVARERQQAKEARGGGAEGGSSKATPPPIPPPTRPSPRPTPSTPPAPTGTAAPTPSRTVRQSSGVQPAKPARSSGDTAESTAPKQVRVAVLLNGKPMGTIVVPEGATDGDLQRAALGIPEVARQLKGKAFRKLYALGVLNITTS
jgi:hypothetical protein